MIRTAQRLTAAALAAALLLAGCGNNPEPELDSEAIELICIGAVASIIVEDTPLPELRRLRAQLVRFDCDNQFPYSEPVLPHVDRLIAELGG